MEKLVADGLARKPRLLALQREHADIMGRRGKNVWDHIAGHGKTDWFINSSPALLPDGRRLHLQNLGQADA